MDKPFECITSFQNGIEVGNRKELIRCKDCGACAKGENIMICVILQIKVKDDFFCADGIKKPKYNED